MSRIDAVKLYRESFSFLLKNLDLLGFVVLATLPAYANVPGFLTEFKQSLSPVVRFIFWNIAGIYTALAWLTIIALILQRLHHHHTSAPEAFKHIVHQLAKGAWWYLIFYMVILWNAQTIRQVKGVNNFIVTLLPGQPPMINVVLGLLYFAISFASMYYAYIIADNYHSLKDTVIKSLVYLKRSAIAWLKIFLLIFIIIAPIAIIAGFLITFLAKIFPVLSTMNSSTMFVLMAPIVAGSFFMTSLLIVVASKLYLHVKSHD